MKFRRDIQGFRAIAVILVLIFHINNKILPGGFIGVDIFFVISGYLISSIILKKKEQKKFGFIDFYLGRIKRIVPVFSVFLLITLIVGLIIYIPIDIRPFRKNIFWASIFNSNNYLSTLDNYFGASSSENPLLHTWTLAIEMQFYFLLPFVIIFLKRKYLFPVCLVAIAILIGHSYYSITELNLKGITYYSLLARMPEFLIGTVFSLKEKVLYEKLKPYQNGIGIISFLLLIGSAFFINENSNFPGLLVLIPCISIGLLLVFSESIINKFFSAKPFFQIGELSYSMYLWHWPIMAFIRYYNMEYSFNLKEVVFIIGLTLTLSFLSYKFIENPIRKSNNIKSLLFIGFFYTLLGLLVFYAPKINNHITDIPPKYGEPVFGMDSHGNTYKNVEFFGDTNKSNDSILFLGDSHALAYKPFLDTIGKKYHFNFYTITNNVYPTIPGIDEEFFHEKSRYDQYSKLIVDVEQKIKESKTIILTCVWTSNVPSFAPVMENFMKGINTNQNVIILTDFPVLDKDPIRVNRGITKAKDFDYNITIKKIPDDVMEVINKFDNLDYFEIDYTPIMKDLPFVNDTIAYYDGGHFNLYGSQAIGNALSDQFEDFP